MKSLGVQAYRFSVSWPRVLPKGQGSANERGLAFYDPLIDELLAAGIEPWLCLYRSDLPQALEDLGGWANREFRAWFADYANLIATRFGDRVRRLRQSTNRQSSVSSVVRSASGTGVAKTTPPHDPRSQSGARCGCGCAPRERFMAPRSGVFTATSPAGLPEKA